jgi:hypothetical protein
MRDPAELPGNDAQASAPLGYVVVAFVFSGLLGYGAGVLMSHVAPTNNSSWAGLAVAPLWLLLELFFEILSAALGFRPKLARVAVSIAVVAAFYVAWFSARPMFA